MLYLSAELVHKTAIPMNARPFMTLGDAVLIAFFLALSGVLFVLLPGRLASGGSDVVIRSDDRVTGRYSLDEDRLVDVPGPMGSTTIRVERGRARVESSPCPNKFCVNTGTVGREGGLIVCVPNRVIVTVGKGTPEGVDAVSR
jgi:hypothetical protein